MAPRTIDPDSPLVAAGQTRIDRLGGRIIVTALAPAGRWNVVYPTVLGRRSILSADTIRELYPIVTDPAPTDRRPA